jgi:hypothetical protein
MQGTLEIRYWFSFFPFLLAPLMAEPLDCWAVGRAQSQGYQLGDTKLNLKLA